MFEAWRKKRAERRAEQNAVNKLWWFLKEIVRAMKAGELRPDLSIEGKGDLRFEFSFRNVRVSGKACSVSSDIFGARTYCSSLTLDGISVSSLIYADSFAKAMIHHQQRVKKEAEIQSRNQLYQTLQGIVDHLPESSGNGKKSGELSLADDSIGAVSLVE
jgi:hypothetical protein